MGIRDSVGSGWRVGAGRVSVGFVGIGLVGPGLKVGGSRVKVGSIGIGFVGSGFKVGTRVGGGMMGSIGMRVGRGRR